MIGEPYSRKANVRFDEGELEIEPSRLLRQISTLLLPISDYLRKKCSFPNETSSLDFIVNCQSDQVSATTINWGLLRHSVPYDEKRSYQASAAGLSSFNIV